MPMTTARPWLCSTRHWWFMMVMRCPSTVGSCYLFMPPLYWALPLRSFKILFVRIQMLRRGQMSEALCQSILLPLDWMLTPRVRRLCCSYLGHILTPLKCRIARGALRLNWPSWHAPEKTSRNSARSTQALHSKVRWAWSVPPARMDVTLTIRMATMIATVAVMLKKMLTTTPVSSPTYLHVSAKCCGSQRALTQLIGVRKRRRRRRSATSHPGQRWQQQ
mmetsp:Transcript_34192/g.71994  ORF Transcript_34192/g.71994 Transcript_34192/m.71994 type:complete len:220 (+) Transcript_34192:1658-2317(+)